MRSVHLQQKIEQELSRVGFKVSEPQLKNLALLSHALVVSNPTFSQLFGPINRFLLAP